MKKLLILLLLSSTLSAQVGIGTTTPQETLHVAGNTSTIRVDGLNTANNPLNNGLDVATVGADALGNLVLYNRTSLTEYGTFLTSLTNVTTASGAYAESTVFNTNITTTANNTLLSINLHTGVDITRHNGALITDGAPRLYGVYVLVNGTQVVYDSGSYTNTRSATVITGFFTVGGSGDISVPAGVHNVQVRVYVAGGQFSTRGQFGWGGSRLTIKQTVD